MVFNGSVNSFAMACRKSVPVRCPLFPGGTVHVKLILIGTVPVRWPYSMVLYMWEATNVRSITNYFRVAHKYFA